MAFLLNEIKDKRGATHSKKRLGRGIGSGKGKTAGRGHKGQKSRSGVSITWFEGGQSPIYRRLPRRGFNNARFKKDYAVVNLSDLQRLVDAGLIKDKADFKTLLALKAIRDAKDGLKVLGGGELKAALAIEAAMFSASAAAAIEKAGGKAISTAKPAAASGKKPKLNKGKKLPRSEKKKTKTTTKGK